MRLPVNSSANARTSGRSPGGAEPGCLRRPDHYAPAHREIAASWIKTAATLGISVPGPSGGAAWCSVTASYSSQYGDFDVYVHSNQPDATATASSGTYSHSWHTDSSGYADISLRGPSPSQAINVTAGSAHCATVAP